MTEEDLLIYLKMIEKQKRKYPAETNLLNQMALIAIQKRYEPPTNNSI